MKKRNGIGIIARARNPSREVAHPTPRALYTDRIVSEFASRGCTCGSKYLLCTVKRGKTAPRVYLETPLAAIAEAPLSGPYTSTRYNAAEVCRKVS